MEVVDVEIVGISLPDNHTMNNNTRNPLTAVQIVSFDSWSQFYLAYIEISYVDDIIYDVIQGEGSVSNCTASC